MIINIPDHFAPTIGVAMVERAARVIGETSIVPAYLHQYAAAWMAGLRYEGNDVSFWQAVGNHDKSLRDRLLAEGLMPPSEPTRHAVIEGNDPRIHLEVVRRFLPSNYTADSDGSSIFIHGIDNAGWTLDGYVIPRLASGLYFAKEVTQ